MRCSNERFNIRLGEQITHEIKIELRSQTMADGMSNIFEKPVRQGLTGDLSLYIFLLCKLKCVYKMNRFEKKDTF